jgi:hypothetical protein
MEVIQVRLKAKGKKWRYVFKVRTFIVTPLFFPSLLSPFNAGVGVTRILSLQRLD